MKTATVLAESAEYRPSEDEDFMNEREQPVAEERETF